MFVDHGPWRIPRYPRDGISRRPPFSTPALPSCPALHADDARGSLLAVAARCGRAASSEPSASCQLPPASQGEGVAVALENVQTARGRAQLDRPRRDAQANEECLLCTTFSSIGIIPYPYVLASGFLIISDCQAKRFIRWMDGWMDGCKFLFYDIGELMLNGH